MEPPSAYEPIAVELLQGLIRNACVNDGTEASGGEVRNAELLVGFLEGSALDLESYEPIPHRRSLVAVLEPPSPRAPILVYLGHTDVVPASPEGWRRDPFGGELVDGEVWGRGAVDMLNLTATMAIACRELAQASRRPPCGLVFAAVADEEAGGTWGAKWLVDHLDVLQRASGVVTEFGGMPFPTAAGVALPVVVGEKGANWCRLTVRGRPGHGSQPFGSDNALVKAAEVVRRLAELRPLVRVCEPWRRFVEALGLPDELASALVDPGRVDEALESLPVALRRQAHACTRTTVVPTVARAGTKVNVIPDRVELQVDVRILPGEDPDEVPAMLLEALGELAADVELERMFADPGSASATDTPLYRALGDAATRLVGSQPLVPMLLPGSTDARFFRELGVPSYGFGLFSGRIPFAEFGSMFHGNDERVDVASLGLSAALFCLVPERFAALVG